MVYIAKQWQCGIVPCKEKGVVSVKVLVQSPGNKARRKKASTDALRLCSDHAAHMVDAMITAAQEADMRNCLMQCGVDTK